MEAIYPGSILKNYSKKDILPFGAKRALTHNSMDLYHLPSIIVVSTDFGFCFKYTKGKIYPLMLRVSAFRINNKIQLITKNIYTRYMYIMHKTKFKVIKNRHGS